VPLAQIAEFQMVERRAQSRERHAARGGRGSIRGRDLGGFVAEVASGSRRW
jgi:hypothetical protein